MAHFVEQAKTITQRENSNEEESVQARIGTRNERWFRACSKHQPDADIAKHRSRPECNPGSTTKPHAESNRCPAAELGSTARDQQPGAFVLGSVIGSSEQQRSIDQSGQQLKPLGHAAVGSNRSVEHVAFKLTERQPFKQRHSFQQHFRSERKTVVFELN